MRIKQEFRRTPEVTYTFEGEDGKYVRLEDYTHDVLSFISALEAETTRRLEAEKTIDMLCDDRIDVLDADLEAKAYRAKYPK